MSRVRSRQRLWGLVTSSTTISPQGQSFTNHSSVTECGRIEDLKEKIEKVIQ
ncbi:hypothetical protein Poly24_29820 [Rosistilla carotiformis]|uniref:Uncharacterized protein n=1 Tax=Rosistilla carotiformis TaxID=2528017 RepID=A0A518JUQ5_9BACT|nr:hypothetical protein Poly24_29820 [Rosistilla carotiformis]